MSVEVHVVACPGCEAMRRCAAHAPGVAFRCVTDGCRAAHYVEPRDAPWVEPPRPRAPTLAPLEVLGRLRAAAYADPDAQADLEWYAAKGWHLRMLGRGLPMGPRASESTGARDAPEDRQTRDWHRAMTIHRRLESLRSGVGLTHVAVLEFVYLTHGAEARTRWASFVERLGWAFATPRQRLGWEVQRKSVRAAAPQRYGARIHDAAVSAYNASRVAA